jgi:alkylation response protein AidB-like acyl-CoA dehydrogenase
MDFELSDEQKMLVDSAAGFAKKSSPVTRLRSLRDSDLGYDRNVWRQMGELGWLGIPFPEALGGFGGRFIDAALVLQQLGTTLVPEPYIPAVVLGGMSVLHAGTAEQHKRWLPDLIEGKTTLALAYAERDSRFDVTRVGTRAERDGGGWKLHGEKVWVLNGHAADHLVVSARSEGDDDHEEGIGLFVVDRDAPGVSITPVRTIDGHRAAMIALDQVAVDGDRALGEAHRGAAALRRVMDLAAAAACNEGVGIARTVLDMTVEYLKTREQFGVAIGTFQALQHRAVDLFIEAQLLESMALLAGIEADADDDSHRADAVSAAKAHLSVSGQFVVRQAIQLHGGIGCTDEHDIGLYFKRMQALTSLFGDEEYHLERYAHLPQFTAGIDD